MASDHPLRLTNHGILDLGLPDSKEVAQNLLWKDHVTRHCFFNDIGFLNHISHHLLAAYDLGADDVVLGAAERVGDEKPQRLIDYYLEDDASASIPKPGEITDENWKTWLGQHSAYQAYIPFYLNRLEKLGVAEVLERYIFADEVNGEDTRMLVRVFVQIFHVFITIAYGIEFGSNHLIAQGLAQAAAQTIIPPLEPIFPSSPTSSLSSPPPPRQNGTANPREATSLLDLLDHIQSSPVFTPPPFVPKEFILSVIIRTLGDGTVASAIHSLSSSWTFTHTDDEANPDSEEEITKKVEEIIWISTLMTFSTSIPSSSSPKRPRIDFYIIHLLTASLFLPILISQSSAFPNSAIPSRKNRRKILQHFVPLILVVNVLRGRPRVDPEMIMSRPLTIPKFVVDASSLSNGDVVGDEKDEDVRVEVGDPWPYLIKSILPNPEAHVLKGLRSLLYAHRTYKSTPDLLIPSSSSATCDTTTNISKSNSTTSMLDPTVFARSAILLADIAGWQPPPSVPSSVEGEVAVPSRGLDRSGLGWREAWIGEGAGEVFGNPWED
ncbi:hypothetical protein SISNIDRAFT_552439 [Sistotremastrum niveocremeum HHB9708]|uniref:Uncharacterized protein n=1 Tax=Sistotremastrum niveocremeum HHB9708 TaxID=1314777 RepID=A0A164PLC8_9AGAM|nr:hypothetical protein SISNIDRAFT_552439 [Sistotremastrum niveocremeum HHB9708]